MMRHRVHRHHYEAELDQLLGLDLVLRTIYLLVPKPPEGGS